jgi:hypothetical protein
MSWIFPGLLIIGRGLAPICTSANHFQHQFYEIRAYFDRSYPRISAKEVQMASQQTKT